MTHNIKALLKEKIECIEITLSNFRIVAYKHCSFHTKGECVEPSVCTSGVREACEWNRCPYGKEA